MGYQESFIYVKRKNIKASDILNLFRKLHLYVPNGDTVLASINYSVYVKKKIGKLSMGQQGLLIQGERSVQQSVSNLFYSGYDKKLLSLKEKYIMKHLKIKFLDTLLFEEKTIQPFTDCNLKKMYNEYFEDILIDDIGGKVATQKGYI